MSRRGKAGNTAGLCVSGASVLFVFMVLAAQYERLVATAVSHPDRADVSAGGKSSGLLIRGK